MKIDEEFRDHIFRLDDQEYKGLEQSIIQEGCRDPLVVWKEEDILLDGHNRFEICNRHKLDYKIKVISLTGRSEALNWIDSNQVSRRNLTPDMLSVLRGRLYNRLKTSGHGSGSAGQNDPQNTAEKIAEQFGVSPATVKRDAAFALEVEASPGLKEALNSRESISKVRKALRTVELAEERQKMAEKGKDLTLPEKCRIEVGDIRTYVTAEQFDFIITDPPYPKEYLDLYEVLADKAQAWLKPGGLLIAMAGQSYLDEIIHRMSKSMQYYWTAAYMLPGQPTPLRQIQVNCSWKPLVMFKKYGEKYTGKIFGDVFTSDQNEKTDHKWQQSISGMKSIISSVCLPGQSIFDPFVGSGTTGLAALEHGCTFAGIDVDVENVAISKARILEVKP